MPIDRDSKKWLVNRFGANVRLDEPMSNHTSLRVGGPAEVFILPESREDLMELIHWSHKRDYSYVIIGGGTNLLVRDNGIKGLVIALTGCMPRVYQTGREKEDVIVTAAAGTPMRALCAYAIRHGLSGMNFALGIPGTVGGGIVMNAGTAFGSMDRVVREITLFRPMEGVKTVNRENMHFSYRELGRENDPTGNRQRPGVILEGSFLLHPSDPKKVRQEAGRILQRRKREQPQGAWSAGCFFKNPRHGETAGELIERAGLKGETVGGAAVSPRHANFIINRGDATASDILALKEKIQESVLTHFNVRLETEVTIIGS